MRKEYDEKLCRDYPEIFRDRHGDIMETAMCWGFDCGDGWYPLIDTLCRKLMKKVNSLKWDKECFEKRINEDKSKWSEWTLNHYSEENFDKLKTDLEDAVKNIPVAVQVKEKYGTLRFYVIGSTDEDQDIIDFVEHLSEHVCEECGSMFAMTYTTGWHKTLCEKHANEHYGHEEANEYRLECNKD